MPYHLTSLVDLKNLPKLTELGGTEGVLRVLGSDPRRSLRIEAASSAVVSEKEKGRSGMLLAGVLLREKQPPADIEKGETSEKVGSRFGQALSPPAYATGFALGVEGDGDGEGDGGDKPPTYAATMEERQTVYGKNVLPGKKSRTLPKLM
jgi:Ca2+-transporting ATPase